MKNKILESRVLGEHIRSWEEHNRFVHSPYPLYRIFAETKENSETSNLMQSSSNYKVIAEEDLEKEVGRVDALSIWHRLRFTKLKPEHPSLVVLAGYPLSGKTTLAKEIVKRSPENTFHIESDKVREFVSASMGYQTPKYNYTESHRTFNTIHELIRIALSEYVNVIFDATNLQERGRIDAYLAAEEYRAPITVLFVEAPSDIINDRLNSADSDKRSAYAHMSETKFTEVTRDFPFIKVETSDSPTNIVSLISKQLPITIE